MTGKFELSVTQTPSGSEVLASHEIARKLVAGQDLTPEERKAAAAAVHKAAEKEITLAHAKQSGMG